MPDRSGTFADDPFGGRPPTSHERMTGLPWDASYHEGPAPWDTGQPQPAIDTTTTPAHRPGSRRSNGPKPWKIDEDPGTAGTGFGLGDHDWDIALAAARSLNRAGQAEIDAILWGSPTRMRACAGGAPTIWTITPPTRLTPAVRGQRGSSHPLPTGPRRSSRARHVLLVMDQAIMHGGHQSLRPVRRA
jgi:hypothetical protein